jgi:hypothetical protein
MTADALLRRFVEALHVVNIADVALDILTSGGDVIGCKVLSFHDLVEVLAKALLDGADGVEAILDAVKLP